MFECKALCQGNVTCAALAWAEFPEDNNDSCKDKGRPRCAHYLTSSGQTAAGTSALSQEYTCYSMVPPPNYFLGDAGSACRAYVENVDDCVDAANELGRKYFWFTDTTVHLDGVN